MFKRDHIDFNEKTGKGSDQSGIRYLYCGLTGVRFARSSKGRHTDDTKTPGEPLCTPSAAYNLLQSDPSPKTPAENEPARPRAENDTVPTGATPEQTIARLTAERDAAECEREIETDYREALLRDLDWLSRQLKETQRRLMDFEQRAHSPGEASQPLGEHERQLEHDLEEARNRICELESMAALSPPVPLPCGQEGMMGVFQQFVALQERHNDLTK